MNQFTHNRPMHILLLLVLSAVIVFGGVPTGLAQQAETGVRWDQPMHIPSPEETSSWFPDLTVDQEERVHVVWCESNHLLVPNIDPESAFYSMWDGKQWSPATDVVLGQQDIVRNAIAVDDYGVLHLLFDHSGTSSGLGLYYTQAPASKASSASAWASPRLVNDGGDTYMSDIALYRDTIHILYDDAGSEGGECPGCADIFYRHSTDRGQTWSAPIDLMPTSTGSSRARIKVDNTGTLYVAWDEGWDRLSGRGSPQYGVYEYSADGGNVWSAPTIVSYPDSTNAQLSVGNDGQGGVMLVWRTTSPQYPGIYYMWSTNHGESWSPPRTLPDIVARGWDNPFDLYDMATDSAKHIHLLVVGHLSTKQAASPVDQGPPGLYHLEWDGNRWSSPMQVYRGDWYPEYPHLVIEHGNQLHATWFIYKDTWTITVPHQVWYAHGQSQAPVEEPVIRLLLTPAATATDVLTATPLPPRRPNSVPDSNATPGRLYTENEQVLQLAVFLLPVFLLVLAVIILALKRKGKLFG